MKKLLSLLVLFPVLFAALLWLSLPWSAQYLIERWLTEQGFDAPAFSMRHPSWERLQIDHLSVHQSGDGRRISLSADNIELQFDPLNLLRGQLAELRVEQARIDIAADHSLKGRAEQLRQQTAPLDLSRFHPQQLFTYAPSRRLVIARLDLNYTAPEQPPLHLEGNIDLEPHLLQSRLHINLDQQPLGYLDIAFTPDYRLQLHVTHKTETVLRSSLTLSPHAEHWTLETDSEVHAEPLLAMLPPLISSMPASLHSLQGELGLHSMLTLPTRLATDAHSLSQLSSRHAISAKLLLPTASQSPGGTLTLEAALELQNGTPQLQLHPSTQLSLQLPEHPVLPPVNLSGTLRGVPLLQPLTGQISLLTQSPVLQLDSQVSLDIALNGTVSAILQPAELKALLPTLQVWLPDIQSWPEIHQGTLSAQAELSLTPPDWRLRLQPRLVGAQVSIDKTHIHDLNLSSRILLQPDGSFTARGDLDIDHTDAGVRLYGPSLSYALTGYGSSRYWLQLTPFSLSALDGIIAVPALGFDPMAPDIDARLAVSAFDLSRILALYPQEGLYGSGVLGGELPIEIKGTEIRIQNGHLLSGAEGGVIRYQPTPEIALMGQQNPGIGLALDALTDLRFDLLDLKLDYEPDGDTVMHARLKGHNPDWQQGRPVDLNLNIEENLLDLLRTLQLTGRVTDSIDRRFRR